MTRYEKLTEALRNAKANAVELAPSEDGGTCNMDYVELYIPRWSQKKVEQCAEAVGLYASKLHRSGCFSVGGYECGQANRRTRMVRAFADSMKEQNFNAFVHCVMD